MIEDMKSKIVNVNVAYYINLDTLRAIEQAVGVQILGKFDDFFYPICKGCNWQTVPPQWGRSRLFGASAGFFRKRP